MRVILFQWRFEQSIQMGRKRSTIRLRARCEPGDMLSLRRWQDKPYRSKQVPIKGAECKAVNPLYLGINSADQLEVYERFRDGSGRAQYSTKECEQLARIEGFDDFAEMESWFKLNHKLKPGMGIECEQIQW
ncbi:MAG: hypothetical protein JNJ83_10845 [Verrucomicrobiaceae bacterium]|nr:hypothetical protein [Verrucomicrobiaceae bacterium]